MEGRIPDWRGTPLQDESDVLCRACIESNLKTRMIVIVPVGTSAADFKERIRQCHLQNFPELGSVRVTKLMILIFGFWYSFNEGSIGVLSRGTDARFKAELEREELLLENGRAEIGRAAAAAVPGAGICGTCQKELRRNCSSSQNNFEHIRSFETSPFAAVAGLFETPRAEDLVLRGTRLKISQAREEGGKGGETRRDVEEEPVLTGVTTAEKVRDETPKTAEERKVADDDEAPKAAEPSEDDETAEKTRLAEGEAVNAAEKDMPTETPKAAEKGAAPNEAETVEKEKPAEEVVTAKATEESKRTEISEVAKAAARRKPIEDEEASKVSERQSPKAAEKTKPVEDGEAAEMEAETLESSEDEAVKDARKQAEEPVAEPSKVEKASLKRKADPTPANVPAKVRRVISSSEDSSEKMDEETGQGNHEEQVEQGTVQAKHIQGAELQAEEEAEARNKQDRSEELDRGDLDDGEDVQNDLTQRSVDSIPPNDLCTSKNADDVCDKLITQHFSDSSISKSAEASSGGKPDGQEVSSSEDSGRQTAPKTVVSKPAAAPKPVPKSWQIAASDSESSEDDAPDPKSKVGLIVPNTVDSEEDEGAQKEKKREVVTKKTTAEEPVKANKGGQAPAQNPAQGKAPAVSGSSTDASDSESSSTDLTGAPAKGSARKTGVDTRYQHLVDKHDGIEQLINFKLSQRKELANTADVVPETQDIDGEVQKEAEESGKGKQKVPRGRKAKETSEPSKKSTSTKKAQEQQSDFETPAAKAAAPAVEVLPSTKTKRKPAEPKTKTVKKARQPKTPPAAVQAPVHGEVLSIKPLATRSGRKTKGK